VNKIYLLIGLVAIGLVLAWTLTKPNGLDDKTNAADGSVTTVEDSADQASEVATDLASSKAIESTKQADSVSSSSENSKTVISPFAVTSEPTTIDSSDNGASLAENSTAQSSSESTTFSASDSDSNSSDQVLRNIEVPPSYPASDAAKYFIPKGERRSGNLGGPPPPPSSGASQPRPPQTGNGVFIAPTVPGQ